MSRKFDNYIVLSCLILSIVEAVTNKPNFIYILTDDQDLLFNSTSVMPSLLENIRDAGIEFKNAFVATPICCPSRTETLTGRYYHNVRLPDESMNKCMHVAAEYNVLNNTQSMFHMFASAGYVTGVFGKLTNNAPNWWCKPMQKGNPPYITGYSRVNIPCAEDYYQLEWFDKYLNESYTLHNITASPANYLTSVEGNTSVKFIKNVIKYYPNKPFIIWIGPHAPHGPATPAEWYANKFRNKKAPRTPTYGTGTFGKVEWIATNPALTVNSSDMIDQEMRDRLRSLVSVDDLINDIFAVLNKYPDILDNTYFIFTSDHGYHLGQFRVPHHKHLPYDTDMRVPMYMRGPKIKPGSVSYDVVGNVDILPTILSLAGISYDSNTYDGMDWTPIFDAMYNDDDQYEIDVDWKRDTFLSQYISIHSQASCGGCWYPGNDGSLYPGQTKRCGCCNNNGQAFMTDNQEIGNWRAIRTINQTDNTVYIEWYQLNGDDIMWNDTIFNKPYYYEFYNLNDDMYQIDNIYGYFSESEQNKFHELLMKYGSCKGTDCN